MRALFPATLAALIVWFGLGVGAVLALQPEERLDDPALEARARALSAELRCVVCQNQSIDESDADMAGDMRRVVRQRLVAGDSDADVKQYLVDRYGDYVLLRPPVGARTMALWVAPAILLLLGGLIAVRMLRSQPVAAKTDSLTDEERRELSRVLRRPPKDSPD
ncbi:MAG: cytochrome c-type biogenesis protein [Pseudomonadota bacterium]